jgi:hypothetical protein
MRSLDDLLDEAKWGELSDKEITYLVQIIKDSKPGEDRYLYQAIHALGLGGAKQYRKLIEGFLYYPSNPMVSGIALKALCIYWNFIHDYLDELKQFVKGVEWDVELEDTRIIALAISGEFLRRKSCPDLLRVLVSVLEGNDIDEIIMDSVYSALARAVGQEWDDYYEDKKPNPLILEKVYQRLEDNN